MALCSGWHLWSYLDNGSFDNEILSATHNAKLSAMCNEMWRPQQGMKFHFVRRSLPQTQNGHIRLSLQWQLYLKLVSAVKVHQRKQKWFKFVAKVWYVTIRHGRCNVKRLQNDTTRWPYIEGVTLYWRLTLYWGYFGLILWVLDLKPKVRRP
jgi:hypothetical protein